MSVYSDEQLRTALEFAFEVLRSEPSVAVRFRLPKQMQQFLRAGKPTRAALKLLRSVLEGRDELRAALGTALSALTEDQRVGLDEVAELWLSRPEGWTERLAALLAERAAAHRAEREHAAEATAARRLRSTEAHLDRARADLEAANGRVARLESELLQQRQAHRELELRLEAALRRLEESDAHARRTLAAAERSASEVADVRRELGDSVGEIAVLHSEVAGLEERLAAALAARVDADAALADLREQASSPAGAEGAERRAGSQVRREPVPVPGGRLESDAETIGYLVRYPGLTVVVDGYNVSHEVWPDLPLQEQRVRLVASVENMVSRTSARVRVVFDAATGSVGWGPGRRTARIEFTDEGVIADDHIRHIVRAMSPADKVLVVTSDRELAASVRQLGANTVSSSAFGDFLLR